MISWRFQDGNRGNSMLRGGQWGWLAQESSDKYRFQTQCSSRTRYSCHPSAWNLSWLILLFLPILHISVPLCHPSHLALTLLVGSFSCSTNTQLAMILRISGSNDQSKNQTGPDHHCTLFDQSSQQWPQKHGSKWFKKKYFIKKTFLMATEASWVNSLYMVMGRADSDNISKTSSSLSSRDHAELHRDICQDLRKTVMDFYISSQEHHVPWDHCLAH